MRTSKKTIAIIAVTIVLAIAAVTGVVMYLNDDGTASAGFDGNEIGTSQSGDTTNPGTGDNDEQNPSNNPDENPGNLPEAGENNARPGTTTRPGTTGNAGTTTSTGNTNVPNQEYVTERIEEVERQITEDLLVGWTSISITSAYSTNNLGIYKPELITNKISATGDANNAVLAGQLLAYGIQVQNAGTTDLAGINVSDIVPEQTKLLEDSIYVYKNGEYIYESGEYNKDLNKIKWKIDVPAGQYVIVGFVVTINEDAVGNIENAALVDGKETNKVVNPIIEANKTSKLYRILETESDYVEIEEPANIGDRIEYIVSAKNTGNVPAVVFMQDTIPANTKLVSDIVLANERIDEATMSEGKNVTVPAGETVTLTFTVEIENIEGTIENIAKIATTTRKDEVKATELKLSKTVSKSLEGVYGETVTLKANETAFFKIELTNTGSLPLELEVSDVMNNKSMDLYDGEEKVTSVTLDIGETKTLTTTYLMEQEDVEKQVTLVNTVKVTEKNNKVTEQEDTAEIVPEEIVKISGTKTWVDYENKRNTRPDYITVQILKGEIVVDTIKVTAEDNWSYTSKWLSKYDANNNTIKYTVKEQAVKGYISTVNGYNITNTLEREPEDYVNKIAEEQENSRWKVELTVPGGVATNEHDEVILMVDGSYSLDQEWPAMKKAIVEIGKACLNENGNTQLTLMAFGMGDNKVLTHIKHVKELEDALGELPGTLLYGRSSTNCESGFTGVAEYIDNHDSFLNDAYVIYISDGRINTDETPHVFYNWKENPWLSFDITTIAKAGLEYECIYIKNKGKKESVPFKTVFGENSDPITVIQNVTDEQALEWADLVWDEVYEEAGLDKQTAYPISDVERAFVAYDKKYNTRIQDIFYYALVGRTYPDMWSRTPVAGNALAEKVKVKALYMVDYDAYSSWMDTGITSNKSEFIQANGIKNLVAALQGVITNLSKTTFNDVIITDYMSKWVKLDQNSIAIVDDTTDTVIYTMEQGWLIEEDKRPTLKEQPVKIELVPASEYVEGGDAVEGNISGEIYKLTWYVKDGAMLRSENYHLEYIVIADNEEAGFEYKTEYPANGKTEVEYKDENGDTKKEDIKVPNVNFKELVTVSGSKTWVDYDNQEQTRPASIVVEVLNGNEIVDTITVTADNDGNWNYTSKELLKYNENDEAITYTVREQEVNGYTSTVDGNDITNTLDTVPTVTVSGSKTWVDYNNQEQTRPANVVVEVLNGNEVVDTITVTPNNAGNWTYTSKELPKYDANNQEITYTVREQAVNGYKATVNGNNITNTLDTVPKVTVSGSKTWVDYDNQEQTRPASIVVEVLNGNEVVDTIIVTQNNEGNWNYTSKELPKYDTNSQVITYTVREQAVNGYTSTVNGNNITNTLDTVPTVTVSGSKTWVDYNNQESTRPTSIVVEVLNGNEVVDTITVTPDNVGNWAYTSQELPKYNANNEVITYTVREKVVSGYTGTVNGYNITNTLSIVPTVTVSGSKTWVDYNNQEQTRPANIVVEVLNGNEVVDTITVTPNNAGNWTYTSKELPKYDANNQVITYTVREQTVSGYTASVNGHNITNTLSTVPTVKVSGTKTWVDYDNKETTRPASIVVEVLDGANVVDTITVTSDSEGNWAYTSKELPKYNASNEVITYTVREQAVSGYTATINGYNITNTLSTVPTVKVSGSKTWVDYNNGENTRPTRIVVEVLNGNEIVDTITVTEVNNWKYTSKELPKYNTNNEVITYTVREQAVSGYTPSIAGTNITNTLTAVPTVKVSGTKTWVDYDNKETTRPASIVVEVLDGTNIVDTITVTPDNEGNWTYTSKALPKYNANNEVITYIVREQAVNGYTPVVDGSNIENTLNTVPTVKISGSKTWIDYNNRESTRPTRIVVEVLNGNQVVDTVTVTPINNWTYTSSELPKYNANNEVITYTVREQAVSGYTTSITGTDITNTLSTVPTVTVSGSKTWVDYDNKETTRPASIVVEVLNGNEVVDTITVIPDNEGNWTYTSKALPKYNTSNEVITYTVREQTVSGYTASVNGYKITNTLSTVPTVKVSGTKTWVDYDNKETTRPASIVVEVLDGTNIVDTITVIPDNEGNWTYTSKALPKYNASNEVITYTVREQTVNGYTASVNGYNITNTLSTVPTVKVSGSKTWVDYDNKETTRPVSIVVEVLNGNEVVDTITVTPDNVGNWTYTSKELPKYNTNNEVITYTVREQAVSGYTPSIAGTNITNTLTAVPTVKVSGTKTWVDYDNKETTRPASIVVEVSDGTNIVDTITVTPDSEGNWTYTSKELPKYNTNNEAITYTVREQTVSGYTPSIVGTNITNTLSTVPTVKVSGTKTWVDYNNGENTRPASITVKVMNGSMQAVDTAGNPAQATVTGPNWTYEITNLPKYNANNAIIEYTVVEEGAIGYTPDYTDRTKASNGDIVANIENTLDTVPTVKVSGIKTWVDNGNSDNTRPTSITVKVMKGSVQAVDTAGNPAQATVTGPNWNYEITNLPKYSANNEVIEYTVVEESVTGYTANYTDRTVATNGNITANITNTLETITVTVYKEWETPHVITHPDVTLQLYKNGSPYRTAITLTAGSDGTWNEADSTGSWSNLPRYTYNVNGTYTSNEYTVQETSDIEQYQVTISTDTTPIDGATASSNNEVTVTNIAKGVLEVVSYINTETRYLIPVDVVLVLDVSGSMLKANSIDNSRAKDMVKSVNETITTIMTHNSESRVAVVTYSSSATTLLPLDHYTPNTAGEYLTCTQDEFSNYMGQYSSASISTNVTQLTNQNTVNVTGATFVQGGIAQGANILAPTTSGSTTKIDERIPILILLTDGEPTKYTEDFNNVNVAGGEKGTGNSTSAEDAYYTIRTAASYKARIAERYSQTTYFYTIGYGVDTLLIRTILNPNSTNINECRDSWNWSTAKQLYNKLAEAPAGVNGYNYANGSYTSGSMSSTELAILLNKFIYESIPSTTYRIFTQQEIASGEILLENIDIDGGFALRYGPADNLTTYVNLQRAINDGVVEVRTGKYYLKLDAIYASTSNIGEQIYVKYHQLRTTP